jgi:hypothetical protein
LQQHRAHIHNIPKSTMLNTLLATLAVLGGSHAISFSASASAYDAPNITAMAGARSGTASTTRYWDCAGAFCQQDLPKPYPHNRRFE